MSGPTSAPTPGGGSRVVVPINLVIAVALAGLGVLLAANACAGDVCLAGSVAGLVMLPTLAVLVGLAVRYLWGRSSLIAVVDAALAAVIVGLSSRTIVQLDVSGMLAIAPFAAAPLVPALRATQEAAHGLERPILLGAFVVVAVVFVSQPATRLGAPIPLLVALALAFPTTAPRPYGAETAEPRATLRDHGEDREE